MWLSAICRCCCHVLGGRPTEPASLLHSGMFSRPLKNPADNPSYTCSFGGVVAAWHEWQPLWHFACVEELPIACKRGALSYVYVYAEETLRPFDVLDKRGNIRTGTHIILATRPNADLWVEGA